MHHIKSEILTFQHNSSGSARAAAGGLALAYIASRGPGSSDSLYNRLRHHISLQLSPSNGNIWGFRMRVYICF